MNRRLETVVHKSRAEGIHRQGEARNRCFGTSELEWDYHDHEWGRLNRKRRYLFEMLTLEGAQAGLSWVTILKRRPSYRRAYHHFNVERIAQMSDAELEEILESEGFFDSEGILEAPWVVRHRKKVYSVRSNAQIFLKIEQEYGSMFKYLLSFIPASQTLPIYGRYSRIEDLPTSTPLSCEMSQDLKRRGMSFVGPTIIYAYLQAIGIVNDHIKSCCCYSGD